MVYMGKETNKKKKKTNIVDIVISEFGRKPPLISTMFSILYSNPN